jgi:hypothetical protein
VRFTHRKPGPNSHFVLCHCLRVLGFHQSHLEPTFHSCIEQCLKQIHNSVMELCVCYVIMAVPFMHLASVAAFSLLRENCTLHATSGHCAETQHSSTTFVHTGSQWKNLSIPGGE